MANDDPLEIQVERTRASRLPGLDLANVPFSSVFSDHMLVAEYRDGGWGQAVIRPYGPLSLAPSVSALQYAVSVFEGLKAHRMPGGEVALFRPWENARRLNRSALRLAMPEVPASLFLTELRRLVRLDQDWVPPGLGTVLWLDGRERRYVEECGVMNVFFVVDAGGGPRVVTPELTGTILPGVTRDSVLTLLREMGVAVEERRLAIDELLAAHDRGALRECFGAGTAATLSHVRRIRYRDKDYELPAVETRSVGPAVRERLVAIATGRAPDAHGWLERV